MLLERFLQFLVICFFAAVGFTACQDPTAGDPRQTDIPVNPAQAAETRGISYESLSAASGWLDWDPFGGLGSDPYRVHVKDVTANTTIRDFATAQTDCMFTALAIQHYFNMRVSRGGQTLYVYNAYNP